MQLIGKRSYGLFLIHTAVFWYVSIPLLKYFGTQEFLLRFAIGGLIGLTISLALANLSYHLFENQSGISLNRGKLKLMILCCICADMVIISAL